MWRLGSGGTAFIPALGRQRQADFWVWGQPGLQSEFHDSQGYTEKPCLKKQSKTKQKEWNNIFTNSTSDRGLISKICKELKKPDINKPHTIIVHYPWTGLSETFLIYFGMSTNTAFVKILFRWPYCYFWMQTLVIYGRHYLILEIVVFCLLKCFWLPLFKCS